MNFSIKKMNEKLAMEILSWTYAKPYDFYNNKLTKESLQEMLDHKYYTLFNGDALFGFFCIGQSAQVPMGNQFGVYSEDMVDIGFGMKPELTGQGNGYEFCSFIFEYIQEDFNATHHRLTVATFNKRAIHLYGKFGFVKNTEFNTDDAKFITMVRKIYN